MHRRCRCLIMTFIGLVLVADHKVKAAACSGDEQCLSIFECAEEHKLLLMRDFDRLRMLKVCGISAGTNEVCCRVPPQPLKIKENSENPFANHRNIGLINNRKCGKLLFERISGGNKTSVGQFPWMALLQYRSKSDDNEISFKCCGSLISKKHVLSAAHCVQVRKDVLFSVRLGEHTISTVLDCDDPLDPNSCNQDNPPVQDIEVDTAIVHEQYDRHRMTNDIALIMLKHEAILNKNIRNVETICLPVSSNQMIENINENGGAPNMEIAGWGRTETNLHASDVLLFAKVPYVSNEECATRLSSFHMRLNSLEVFRLMDTNLCAGGYNKTDACKGDSGSPIMYPAEYKEGKYQMFMHGVVSLGLNCSSAETLPGVYTRVSKYLLWILENLS